MEPTYRLDFRYTYLTYLKLLSELNDRTEQSEENDDEAESEEIIFPPSHSLTQTDREYFNIVRTEDGQSSYTRESDMGDRHWSECKDIYTKLKMKN